MQDSGASNLVRRRTELFERTPTENQGNGVKITPKVPKGVGMSPVIQELEQRLPRADQAGYARPEVNQESVGTYKDPSLGHQDAVSGSQGIRVLPSGDDSSPCQGQSKPPHAQSRIQGIKESLQAAAAERTYSRGHEVKQRSEGTDLAQTTQAQTNVGSSDGGMYPNVLSSPEYDNIPYADEPAKPRKPPIKRKSFTRRTLRDKSRSSIDLDDVTVELPKEENVTCDSDRLPNASHAPSSQPPVFSADPHTATTKPVKPPFKPKPHFLSQTPETASQASDHSVQKGVPTSDPSRDFKHPREENVAKTPVSRMPSKGRGRPPKLPSRDKVAHLQRQQPQLTDKDVGSVSASQITVSSPCDSTGWYDNLQDLRDAVRSDDHAASAGLTADAVQGGGKVDEMSPTSPPSQMEPADIRHQKAKRSGGQKVTRPTRPPPCAPLLKQQNRAADKSDNMPIVSPTKKVEPSKAINDELRQMYARLNNDTKPSSESVVHYHIKTGGTADTLEKNNSPEVDINLVNNENTLRRDTDRRDTIRILPRYNQDFTSGPIREKPKADYMDLSHASSTGIGSPVIQLKPQNGTISQEITSPTKDFRKSGLFCFMDGGEKSTTKEMVTSPERENPPRSPTRDGLNKPYYSTKPPPTTQPPKPPRTFKHEEYLAQQQARQEPAKPVSPVSTFKPVIEEKPETKSESPSDRMKGKDKLDDGRTDQGYEEVNIKKPAKRQPPPRPRTLPRSKTIVVRSPKHVKSPMGGTITQVTNPNYNDWDPEDIPIISYRDKQGNIKRHKSDEYLYAIPVVNKPPAQPPEGTGEAGQTPGRPGLQRRSDDLGVTFDQEGYAVPDIGRKRFVKHNAGINRSPSMVHRRLGPRRPGIPAMEEHNEAQEKVTMAYSVVRRESRRDHGHLTRTDSTSDDDTDETDSVADVEEVKQRINKLVSVKAKHYATTEYKRTDEWKGQLFTYAVIIGLERDESAETGYKPYEMFKFPENVTGNTAVPQFCFPDPSLCVPGNRVTSEMFSFVLTDETGKRQYGYCRRTRPPKEKLPEVICVMSSLDAYAFYRTFLRELENQRFHSMEQVQHVIMAAYGKPLPPAGREAWVTYQDHKGEKGTLILRRPKDPRLEQVTYRELIKQLSLDKLMQVFGSLLLERRIILTSCRLSVLSSCAHALISLLYPFTWQHVYIPVLPRSLIDVCASPAPFVVGILEKSALELKNVTMEEVCIVDLDTNQLVERQGDENRIMPPRLQKGLMRALQEGATMDQKPGGATVYNQVIFEAFLHFFVETCGHYAEYFTERSDGTRVFQKEVFATTPASRSHRMFLEWFTETQMFEVFISEKMKGTGTATVMFDERIKKHQEDMEAMPPSLRANMRQFGKKMKNLMMEQGEKLKRIFTERSRQEIT